MSEGIEKGRSATDQQRAAIDLLVAGGRPTEVAEMVGISRENLWRWRKKDAGFIALMEEVRAEAHAARMDRFWSLTDKAHDVIEESLDEGDPRAAMDILKLGARGLTDVEYITTPSTIAEIPEASSSRAEPDRIMCPDCGLGAKSERGLTTHRNAKHTRHD